MNLGCSNIFLVVTTELSCQIAVTFTKINFLSCKSCCGLQTTLLIGERWSQIFHQEESCLVELLVRPKCAVNSNSNSFFTK